MHTHMEDAPPRDLAVGASSICAYGPQGGKTRSSRSAHIICDRRVRSPRSRPTTCTDSELCCQHEYALVRHRTGGGMGRLTESEFAAIVDDVAASMWKIKSATTQGFNAHITFASRSGRSSVQVTTRMRCRRSSWSTPQSAATGFSWRSWRKPSSGRRKWTGSSRPLAASIEVNPSAHLPGQGSRRRHDLTSPTVPTGCASILQAEGLPRRRRRHDRTDDAPRPLRRHASSRRSSSPTVRRCGRCSRAPRSGEESSHGRHLKAKLRQAIDDDLAASLKPCCRRTPSPAARGSSRLPTPAPVSARNEEVIDRVFRLA
jgi:hypothetical protein